MTRNLIAIAACIFSIAPLAHAQNTTFKNPPELGKPNGYSHVVIVNHGKLVFVSGQVGLNSKGEISSDFAAQAKQAFANLKTALAAAGATPAELVKLNYYVVGLNHDKLAAFREARDIVIDKQHPQSLFRDDVQIEIDAADAIP